LDLEVVAQEIGFAFEKMVMKFVDSNCGVEFVEHA